MIPDFTCMTETTLYRNNCSNDNIYLFLVRTVVYSYAFCGIKFSNIIIFYKVRYPALLSKFKISFLILCILKVQHLQDANLNNQNIKQSNNYITTNSVYSESSIQVARRKEKLILQNTRNVLLLDILFDFNGSIKLDFIVHQSVGFLCSLFFEYSLQILSTNSKNECYFSLFS